MIKSKYCLIVFLAYTNTEPMRDTERLYNEISRLGMCTQTDGILVLLNVLRCERNRCAWKKPHALDGVPLICHARLKCFIFSLTN